MINTPPDSRFSASILPLIEAHQNQFTRTEQTIARYFLDTFQSGDSLAASALASRLEVSEAALTRFAQKCGFKGYRELIYACQHSRSSPAQPSETPPVLATYQELLNKTYSIVHPDTLMRITELLLKQKRVYIYGKGSSGLVAREMKLRFSRIGLVCEAITEDDLIKTNEVILDKSCLVVAFSISGKTPVILKALQAARKQQAKVLLITAHANPAHNDYTDIVQLIALRDNLEYGRLISPQFPALVVLDQIYAAYMATDPTRREALWQRSFQALTAP